MRRYNGCDSRPISSLLPLISTQTQYRWRFHRLVSQTRDPKVILAWVPIKTSFTISICKDKKSRSQIPKKRLQISVHHMNSHHHLKSKRLKYLNLTLPAQAPSRTPKWWALMTLLPILALTQLRSLRRRPLLKNSSSRSTYSTKSGYQAHQSPNWNRLCNSTTASKRMHWNLIYHWSRS